jgi:hypothetical protein
MSDEPPLFTPRTRVHWNGIFPHEDYLGTVVARSGTIRTEIQWDNRPDGQTSLEIQPLPGPRQPEEETMTIYRYVVDVDIDDTEHGPERARQIMDERLSHDEPGECLDTYGHFGYSLHWEPAPARMLLFGRIEILAIADPDGSTEHTVWVDGQRVDGPDVYLIDAGHGYTYEDWRENAAYDIAQASAAAKGEIRVAYNNPPGRKYIEGWPL